MELTFQRRSAAVPPVIQPNSFGAYIVIHKIHLMNLKNAATLVPDAPLKRQQRGESCVRIQHN